MAAAHCHLHPDDPAVAVCAGCYVKICEVCFAREVDGEPACPKCAYISASHRRRRVSMSVSMVGLAWGGVVLLARRPNADEDKVVIATIVAAVASLIALFLAAYTLSKRAPEVVERAREEPLEVIEEEDAPGPGGPYRKQLRRVLRPLRPRISAASTILALVVSMVVAALALPRALSLPTWLEWQAVVGLWWGLVAVLLAGLLFRGYRLKDDWVYYAPWESGLGASPPAPSSDSVPKKRSGCDAFSGCDGCPSVDAEGALVLLLVALAVAALAGAAWVVVEVAAPLVFFVVYGVLLRALRSVAHDKHGCEGDLVKSLGWGALWSTVYLLPVALIIAGIHFLPG